MEKESLPFKPVIIIGAGRSGTNMLRDVLTSLPEFTTWPCDEINYIWRHGNLKKETDEFTVNDASPRVKNFVRKEFMKLAKKNNAKYVVEKTCANSLRVEFVDNILPESKFVYIVRDGIDVTASAQKRWTASLDIPYILKKARYVPITDIPYYGTKFILNRAYKLFSKEKRLAFWGPKFNGMTEAVTQYTLPEVCALQWKKCVDKSDQAFQQLSSNKYIKIKYEEFVKNPVKELVKICEFLDCDVSNDIIESSVKNVSAKSVGQGQKVYDSKMKENIRKLIKDTMVRHGYE